MRTTNRIFISLLLCLSLFACDNKGSFNINDAVQYEDSLKWLSENTLQIKGLRCYYDYDDAIRASKKYKKPIMLFFNGTTCVSCRVIERKVLDQKMISDKLRNDFIVAHLFVDAVNINIPQHEQYESNYLKMRVTSLGQKNADIQASKFNTNSQPLIFFIDENEKLLADKGYNYNPDPAKFIAHLDAVLKKYALR